jgi:uncharacterized membrane protein
MTTILVLSIVLNAVLFVLWILNRGAIRIYRKIIEFERSEKVRYKEHLFLIIKRAIEKSIKDDGATT